MRTITSVELSVIIANHKLWLEYKPEGSRANLSRANLNGANLNGANLNGADLNGADLNGANLSGADLNGANLSRANLNGADLSRADLSRAKLNGANLNGADLNGANLNGADLNGANLDYSCLPLWCGSLYANFDDKQLVQIAFHLVKAGLQSENASEETKKELSKLTNFANKFHRVKECGAIETTKIGENEMRHKLLNHEKYDTAVSIRDFFQHEMSPKPLSGMPAPTIIITGRPGPTGKTWLREELRAMGYNAFEILENLYMFVEYSDDKNHVAFDGLDNTYVVILNKRLEGM